MAKLFYALNCNQMLWKYGNFLINTLFILLDTLVSFCASKIHHIDIKTTHHYEKCLDINQYFFSLVLTLKFP